ncbi:MAG TPA: polyphosphate kinase 1 [Steroidobacteraceae bacterium]|jgi:polyphosphate kinase|nr:polyphosphate kinase 1 [Steroidobacteraceae bacterium]
MDQPDLRSAEHYINRELSLLDFNGRVLAQALDARVPLLERLKFLCISSNNLDEFFEIRVAGLKQRLELGSNQPGADGLTITEQLQAIHDQTRSLVDAQYACLNDVLLPALWNQGIELLARAAWDTATAHWLARYFEREVEPVLSPLGLDPARPFPRIQNKSLNFIVRLAGQDAFGRDTGLAIVQAPRSLPRVVALPEEGGRKRFVLLSGIVQQFVSRLFSGMEVLGCYQFRVTRNSDLFVDDEEVDDLRRALEGELAHRRYGAAVRLEVSSDCPPDLDAFLMRQFTLNEVDFYEVDGPVNLNRLDAIYDLVQRPDLKYPIFTPGLPRRVAGSTDLLSVIRQKDVLLHHPFHSFGPVLDFLRGAAADPRVLAIKQTLYRTGNESPIVEALVASAHSGKDVTVIVELRARFDEEANIELSNRLQEAGAHVMYGVVGFKTHCKMSMVVRRESAGLRRYCHLGTGNYHPRTARGYTDYSLFTCDPQIGQDVHELFLQLTSLTQTPQLSRLLQSPFGLHEKLLEKIDRETRHANSGQPARIIAKMNSLVEPKIIEALYRASRAGVKVDLIIRGLCALRPGIPGVSENIRVRSIVGRFLEHSRVFYFSSDGDSELYLASADWMERNFFRRVEIAFPVREQTHRDRILRDLDSYLADNNQSWALGPDGRYTRRERGNEPVRDAQAALLTRYAAGSVPVIVP